MKITDKTSVLVVAAQLMIANGSTTTLEVKNELRNQGYDARQIQISQFMSELASEESWASVDSDSLGLTHLPNHLVYSASTGIAATPTVVTPTVTSTTNGFLSAPTIGCWEVNSVYGSAINYIDGSLTRDKARALYVQRNGGLFADTRSRRVKS